MARRFTTNVGTRRLDLGDGDYVEIKAKFSVGDRAAITQSIIGGGIRSREERDDDGNAHSVQEMGSFNVGASNIATMMRGIVSWGGPGFCVVDHYDEEGKQTSPHREPNSDDSTGDAIAVGCRPKKVTESTIRDLIDSDGTGDRILSFIESLNPKAVEGSSNP